MDIGNWLRSLGLGKYEAAFRDNEIDETVLAGLTHENLKELGVSALGHRLRLLDAIAGLRTDSIAPAPVLGSAPAMPPAATSTFAVADAAGERRHVTVLFCDLVGSTSIAAALDAEDWRDLISAYLDAASVAVTEMDGHIAKKLGDGLMALFGYPVAHENDAERAARAALAIQRALAEVNRKNVDSGKPVLTARIGVAAGPVVLDPAGEIYGDAPNTAARVQALAEPGTVLVTADVQRQIAGLFVVEESSAHHLKGVPGPVTVFRLVGASGSGRRSGQRHLTPLVGREEELAILMRRWERARQGDGQLVMIIGEPGIGKSRLIDEFHLRFSDTPHTWVEWSCSQLLENTPLHPVTEWGRQRFGTAEVPADQRLADLESTLARIKLGSAENVELLAPLVDIPLPGDRVLNVAPEEWRRRQLGALTAWVMAGARTQPAVLALEDVHWADPTTLETLRGIAERGALAPLLVLITARPEFRPPWGARSHHGTISLVPLDRHQVRDMVGEIAARHAFAKEVIESVSERTGGVPLFVEEVTRLLLERGEQGGIQTIPPTLQQSLTARLDRLGSAREVAQIGAVIGRDFSYALIRAAGELEDGSLQTALERLAEADILLVQGLPPNSEYRFKHALIQNAAYESLLKRARQQLHARIATSIEGWFPQLVEAQPELVARHCKEAGLAEKAIPYWLSAGRLAAGQSANMEAIAHFRSGLECAQALLPGVSRSRLEVSLHLALGGPLIATKGYASLEVEGAYQRALELSRGLQSEPDLFTALTGLSFVYHVRGNMRRSAKIIEEVGALARRTGDPELVAEAGHDAGIHCFHRGQFQDARNWVKRSAEARENPAWDNAVIYGINWRVLGRTYISHCDWHLGYPDRSLKVAEEALSLAREISHPFSIAIALNYLAMLYQFRREPDAALRVAVESRDICAEYRFDYYSAWSNLVHAWAIAESSRLDDDLSAYEVALAEFQQTGAGLRLPHHLGMLAALCRGAGKATSGIRRIDEAVAIADANDETWCTAELHRERAELVLLERGEDAENRADAELQTAIEIAIEQQAKLPELRASVVRARLLAARGKRQQARELLAPVHDWFTEGFDTRDLKEARALLEELA
jgi:class 3 adenylate cyclase/predicted ATPase